MTQQYLSDEQIAASYIDFKVTEVQLGGATLTGRVEIGLQIEFPHREDMWDNFVIDLNDPDRMIIACDHWYPEVVSKKLVATVEYWATWKCDSCGNNAGYIVIDSDPEYMGMCGVCGWKDVGPKELRA